MTYQQFLTGCKECWSIETPKTNHGKIAAMYLYLAPKTTQQTKMQLAGLAWKMYKEQVLNSDQYNS